MNVKGIINLHSNCPLLVYGCVYSLYIALLFFQIALCLYPVGFLCKTH